VLDDHRALEHGPDMHRLAAYDSVESGRDFVIQRRDDAGERDQLCGAAHVQPPATLGWADKKSADRWPAQKL
jgi:hypothetical protein